jgi:hypothetical protein
MPEDSVFVKTNKQTNKQTKQNCTVTATNKQTKTKNKNTILIMFS